jgi:alkylation response protein AidB-like acyl-CoA dehydrogenase
LRGEKTHVLNAPTAELMVAPFRCSDSDEIALFVIERGATGLSVRNEVGLDATRRTGRVTFDGVSVGAASRLAEDGLSALRDIYQRGYVLLAAEMVGAADAALQAVKHPLAEAMIAIEQARSLTYAAAAELDHAKEASEVLPRMAKARASDAFFFIGHRSIQFHGGFGFTIDCDAHFFLKRAMWSRATLGDASHHRKHLAGELFGD